MKQVDSPSASFANASENLANGAQKFEKLGYAPWLTDDAETPQCSSRATYSWPNAPWCTE